MSQTAPPNHDITAPDHAPSDDDASQESQSRDWKRAVIAVSSTVTGAAVEAVAIVGDAARTLKARTVGTRQGEGERSSPNGHEQPDDPDAPSDDPSNGDAPAAGPPGDGRATVRASVATVLEKVSSRTRRGHGEAPAEPQDVPANGAGNGAIAAPPRAPAPDDEVPDERAAWAFRPGTDDVESPWLPPLRQRAEHRRSWLVRAATFVLATLAGLAAIIVIAAALLPRAIALAADSTQAELILPEDTDFNPLAARTRVFYSDGSLLAILHGEQDRNPVSIDKMPDHAWQAIVAEEDRKFFEHDGYDPSGILRALIANFQAGGVEQGGSTISQQVARMNFEEVGLDQSIERKIKEVIYAIAIERKFEKNEILNRYANQVYFGAGSYGLQAASEEFFSKNVVDIEVDEAALLAGLISSPTAYNPRDYPERALQQRNLVLRNMARAGYISDAEASEYASKPLDISPPSKGTNKQPSIVEAIMREVKSNPVFGATEQEREDNLFNGGLRITTTINKRLQKLAEQTVEERYSGDGPTAAIASINPRTGAIVAAASAKKYNRDNFSLALQGRRQPGSAFKPFVMAEALRQGFSPGTTLDAKSPLVIPQPGKDWTVQNYGGQSYGPMNMHQATAKSVNTYYAQLMMMVGVKPTVELVEKMGIRSAAFGDAAYPSMVLGGLTNGTTPAEMASAYGVFANNGVHVEPHLLKEVKRGKQSLLDKPKKTKVLEPGVNAVALDIMRGPVSPGGTAAVSVPNFPVIGKTGTTQLATDAWFVGATPVMSTAVWVGYPTGQIRMPGYTGGQMAAPVWQAYMSGALDGREAKDFPDADDAQFTGKMVDVPDVVGLSAQDALAKLAKAKLVGRVQQQSSQSPVGTVIWASPKDEAEMGTTVYVGVSSGPPPPPEKKNDDDRGGGGGDDDDDGGGLGDQIRDLLPGNGNGNGNGNGDGDD